MAITRNEEGHGKKRRGQKSETKNSGRRHSILVIRKTNAEEEMRKQLSDTTAMLSNFSLTESIKTEKLKDVLREQIEDEYEEGKTGERLSKSKEQDLKEMKRKEMKLLMKKIISLDLCQ